MPCFLPLLSRPDKLCATTSNQGGFQRQAPLFGMLALIFLCKGGKLCSVWNLSSLQCVFPAGWCIVLHRRQAPKSAGLLLLCQQLRKLYSLQHLHENSSHILPRLVPEQIPFKHSCEGPDDMPAHAKVKIVRALISYPPFSSPGLPSWFQSHPSHLRRPSDPRDLAGDAPLSLTFQGVWLCEHRDRAGPRKVLVTVNGVIRDPIRCCPAFIGTLILFRQYFINNCSPIYRLYPTASK